MHEETVIAGFGGQGVIFMGKLLTYLGMKEGHHVTYIPSYGAEVRGGTANCTVIISSEPIASPLSIHPSSVIVMNQPSLERFEPRVRVGGLMVLNSSLLVGSASRGDLEVVTLAANEAAEAAGSERVANMVVLGAYLARRPVASIERTCELLPEILPARRHDLLEVNRKALVEGARLGRRS